MGEIIDFPLDKDNGYGYSMSECGGFSVDFSDHPISIVQTSLGFFIEIDGKALPFDRMRLASFLHASAMLVDSEGRAKDSEYIGTNYEEETMQ